MLHSEKILKENGLGTSVELAEEEKLAAQAKADAEEAADRLAAEEEEKRKAAEEELDVPNEKLLEMLKKKGISVDSIEALKPKPTAEEEEEVKKKKKADAFKYAVDANIFTQEEYDSFAVDSKREKVEIARNEFKRKFKATVEGTEQADEYSDEDIDLIFNREFLVDDEEDSPIKKIKVKEIDSLANSYLKKYEKIQNHESLFDEYNSNLAKATSYKATVDEELGKFKENVLEFKIGDTKVNYKPSEEAIAKVMEMYTNPDMYKKIGNESKEVLQNAILSSLQQVEFSKIVSEIAENYHATELKKINLGRQGIIDRTGSGQQGGATAGTTTPHADGMINSKK